MATQSITRTYGDAGHCNDIGEQVPSYGLRPCPLPATLAKESDEREDLVIAHGLWGKTCVGMATALENHMIQSQSW